MAEREGILKKKQVNGLFVSHFLITNSDANFK
ncbi:hypothetical protein EG68_10645 [Paragonimus skrjabini miyazakii]|uniref:Uncharacterized protein n=1 Tax=Paragonimus skrjabini miyazakii TaxID=59628 RepID=A0A8S9YFX0_9TREM|nr:hypothetical protein EG68_10645 [Paragonimus skrjabini miyazakii]